MKKNKKFIKDLKDVTYTYYESFFLIKNFSNMRN